MRHCSRPAHRDCQRAGHLHTRVEVVWAERDAWREQVEQPTGRRFREMQLNEAPTTLSGGAWPFPHSAAIMIERQLLCAKCCIQFVNSIVVSAQAGPLRNNSFRQLRIELTRMINRASRNPLKTPLRKALIWYEQLSPSEAFSFRTCFLLFWTMIITMATYGLADLMTP